jgi:hypothetical protein
VPRDNRYWNLPFITGIQTRLGSLGEKTISEKAIKAINVITFIGYLESGLKEAVAEVNMDHDDYLKLVLIKGGAEVRVDNKIFTSNLFVLSKYFDLYLAWDDLNKFLYVDVRFEGQLIIKYKES